jgi:hypothetical protein
MFQMDKAFEASDPVFARTQYKESQCVDAQALVKGSEFAALTRR